ncbi:MAG: hypothetical protein NVSMB25_20010 [Thermoleophilaceae bacterium]
MGCGRYKTSRLPNAAQLSNRPGPHAQPLAAAAQGAWPLYRLARRGEEEEIG